jgi:hypothetical protein
LTKMYARKRNFALKKLTMLKNIIITAFFGIVFFLLNQIGLSQFVHPECWLLLAFFFAVGYMNTFLAKQSLANNRANFIGYVISMMAVRLLASIGLFIYYFFNPLKQLNLFVATFFVLYLVYTGFEIRELLANLRPDSRNEGKK